MERKYELRERLEEVHKPNRRNSDIQALLGEVEITEDWRIVVSEESGRLLLNTAKDLQETAGTGGNGNV
ncbi:hypothetical protein D3C73_955540 [compost metagenome]